MALINGRNLAHDFGVKLACVVTLAALAGEMAGIHVCDTYIYLW